MHMASRRVPLDTRIDGQAEATPKILVADDDPMIRELLTFLLADEGYAVQTAADGREALECIDRERPDLVICDIFMPRLDGWSFAGLLRQRAKPIPIVMMSGRCSRTRVGSFCCIDKPFASEVLLAVVEEALH